MAFWRTSRGNDAEQDRGIETDLRDTLARVEQIRPTWKTEQYERRPVSRDYNDRDRTGEELYYDELEDKFLESDPFRAVTYQERLLGNTGAWRVSMMFVQNTPDGELKTYVHSSSRVAIVSVALHSVGPLASWDYTDAPDVTCGQLEWVGWNVHRPDYKRQVSPIAVLHVREWVRRRILPMLEAARTQRDLVRRERSECDLQEDRERSATLEEMRRRYL